jgi:hypothetical protein
MYTLNFSYFKQFIITLKLDGLLKVGIFYLNLTLITFVSLLILIIFSLNFLLIILIEEDFYYLFIADYLMILSVLIYLFLIYLTKVLFN